MKVRRISLTLPATRLQIDIRDGLLLLWLCSLFILTVVRFLLVRIGITEGIGREIILVAVSSMPLILLICLLNKFPAKLYSSFCALFAATLVIMLVSVILNGDLLWFYMRETYGIQAILRPDCAIYAFLFFSLVDRPGNMRKVLTVYAFLDFFYLLIIELIPALIRGYWEDVAPDGSKMQMSYSLSFGYLMALPTVIFMYLSYKERKPVYYVFAAAGLLSILTNGNRGALLIPIAFCALMWGTNVLKLKDPTKKGLIITGVAGLAALVVVFREQLQALLGAVVELTGIQSRSINMIVEGTITSDNGRLRIWNTVINAIRTGGPLGHGILGDRPYVYHLHVAGYSHNIVLEILCSFGIAGVFLILYLVSDIIWMLTKCKDEEWRELYIIFLASSCQLLLSKSFWYVWEFWAAAAIAYKCRRKKL